MINSTTQFNFIAKERRPAMGRLKCVIPNLLLLEELCSSREVLAEIEALLCAERLNTATEI